MQLRGHQVTVLCADKILLPESLMVNLGKTRVIRTKWFNVNFLPQLFFGGREQVIKQGYKTGSSFIKNLGYFYRLLTNFPDERVGWLPFAIHAGNKLLAREKFDLIYASSPTPTSLIAASKLSRKWSIPWIAEFRDPWADQAHYDFPDWRRKIEKNLEKKVLKNVSGIVTVSDDLADEYQRKYQKPALTAMNGYSLENTQNITKQPDNSHSLNLVYTGALHYEIVHLEPLFEAIARLDEYAKRINLHFYTKHIEGVNEAAKKFGVESCISHSDLVPYSESIKNQRNADILLFFIPHKYGIITTKIYEYIAALRPVLAIGDPKTTAGKFIQQLAVGLVSEDTQEIAAQLKIWLDQKSSAQGIPDLPESKRKGFSRDEQFTKIEGFFSSLLLNREK